MSYQEVIYRDRKVKAERSSLCRLGRFFSFDYLKALQIPIHTRASEIEVMPNLRLLMPKGDLLLRIRSLCLSSCDMPEK